MVCVAHGAAMVIPAEYFDALATLQAIAEERCTAVHGVPTMFIAELEHPRFREFDLSSLRTGIMAGSPCPINVMRRVVRGNALLGTDHRLRPHGNLAGHHPDHSRRPAGAARDHRGQAHGAHRNQDHRHAHRPHCSARNARASCARAGMPS